MNSTLQTVINVFAAPVVAYLVAAVYYGIYRRITARIHRRWGPPFYQNLMDNAKLFCKTETMSHGIMFYFGPIIMAAGSVTSLLFIPFFNDSLWFSGVSAYGNLILITYLMVIGPLGNALAVGVSGNPFGVMGVTRGLTRMIGLEVAFFIAIGLLMWVTNTTSLLEIIALQNVDGGTWNMFQYPLLFIISLFAFLGFMGSSPFDVAGAPPEVYSGPAAEFGAKFLGLLMGQSLIFSFAKLILWVNLFMGGASNWLELIAKTFSLFLFQALWGAVFPRYRVEQAVDVLWKIPFVLGIIATIIILFQKGAF